MTAIDPALASRNRQAAEDAARRRRNAERRRVLDLGEQQMSPVEHVRLGRDVEESKWRDPDDRDVQRRTPKTVTGHRKVDRLLTMMRDGVVTAEQAAAGVKLRDKFEIAEGACPGGRETGGGGALLGPGDVQLAAVACYRDAIHAVPASALPVTLHVVLDNGSLSAWAEPRGKQAADVLPALRVGLDALAVVLGVTLEDLRGVEG